MLVRILQNETIWEDLNQMKTEDLNLYIFTGGFPYYPYRSRTGIVLDDTEYKPMGVMNRPIITAPSPVAGHVGDIFDVTVTAIQGPGSGSTGQPFIYPGERNLI
jgi:hypothetical protein